jgi:hypothetical protein
MSGHPATARTFLTAGSPFVWLYIPKPNEITTKIEYKPDVNV